MTRRVVPPSVRVEALPAERERAVDRSGLLRASALLVLVAAVTAAWLVPAEAWTTSVVATLALVVLGGLAVRSGRPGDR